MNLDPLPPLAPPKTCTKCGRIITVWESFDFPADWVAKYPELKGMCMDCYREWCENHERGKAVGVH